MNGEKSCLIQNGHQTGHCLLPLGKKTPGLPNALAVFNDLLLPASSLHNEISLNDHFSCVTKCCGFFHYHSEACTFRRERLCIVLD